MTTINLYKPGYVDIKVPFPTEWNELTAPELEFIAPYILSDKPVPWEQIFFELLSLRLKSITTDYQSILKKLDPEQLFIEGLPLVEFIKQDNTLTKFPYNNIPGIDSPKDNFNSIQVVMYEKAAIHSHKWSQGNTNDLSEIIRAILNPYQFATHSLFTIEGWYNRYKTWRTNQGIKKITPAQIGVIFLWYMGCENQLKVIFPRIFDSSKTTEKSNAASFTKCIHQAATSGNYKRSDIRLLELKELLFDIECALELQEKQEQEAKENE